jgi:signal transduction histidine kinase
VQDLRASAVANDLGQALQALDQEIGRDSAAGFQVLIEGAPRALHPILRDEIYRIAREAVQNAFRHARAHHIEAEIAYESKLFRLRIRDDGQGIEPQILTSGARRGHWGLPGMRERAKRIGGRLDIWSRPGAGTEIELSVPGTVAYGGSEGRNRRWVLPGKATRV